MPTYKRLGAYDRNKLQDGREPSDAAFHLGADDVGIDRNTAAFPWNEAPAYMIRLTSPAFCFNSARYADLRGTIETIHSCRSLEDTMADGSSGGIGILGVIVGAVIVAAVGAFLVMGPMSGGGKTTGVAITVPTK